MAVDHYENFPVASWLCPPALRAPIEAIYHYARTADDLADEGDADPTTRLADLAAYRAALHAVARGHVPSAGERWAPVFTPLAEALLDWDLPLPWLEALLDAFEQDVRQSRWPDRAALMDYSHRSADPVGRLLLHLCGLRDETSLRLSDGICTALQLVNFWQDVGVDARRDRIYLPREDMDRHGVNEATVLAGQDSPALQGLVLELCAWTREGMLRGAPLVHRMPGRLAWELRFVVQGGLRILDRIEALGGRTLIERPKLGTADLATMAWRAVRM